MGKALRHARTVTEWTCLACRSTANTNKPGILPAEWSMMSLDRSGSSSGTFVGCERIILCRVCTQSMLGFIGGKTGTIIMDSNGVLAHVLSVVKDTLEELLTADFTPDLKARVRGLVAELQEALSKVRR